MQTENYEYINVRLISHSTSLGGTDIATFELEYPRYIHSEILTHRMFSRNAQSSRAVPVAKTGEINALNPVKPLLWGKNKAGMSSVEELEGSELLVAKMHWANAAEESFNRSKQMSDAGLHKQWANRITEWCSRIKVVVTATEWDNFFWLRDDEHAAQPEIVHLARKMKEVLGASTPEQLLPGEWHTPYVGHKRGGDLALRYFDTNGNHLTVEEALKISASCCGQVSYRKLDDSKEKALEIYEKLFSGPKPHLSPVEHQATPIESDPLTYTNTGDVFTWEHGITHMDSEYNLWSANFKSWIQYRQILSTGISVNP
jgi:hypothetical protein